jgi:hypothetical protein
MLYVSYDSTVFVLLPREVDSTVKRSGKHMRYEAGEEGVGVDVLWFRCEAGHACRARTELADSRVRVWDIDCVSGLLYIGGGRQHDTLCDVLTVV